VGLFVHTADNPGVVTSGIATVSEEHGGQTTAESGQFTTLLHFVICYSNSSTTI